MMRKLLLGVKSRAERTAVPEGTRVVTNGHQEPRGTRQSASPCALNADGPGLARGRQPWR